MKPNFKKIFKSDLWIITNIIESLDGKRFRVDAKTRFYIPGGQNSFSKWGKANYLNRLCRENYGKKLKQHSKFGS